MLMIVLTRSVQVNGAPHLVGDVVTAADEDARYLLHAGQARMATAEDIRTARNPRPASEVRRLQEAQAIKGGPRPQRRG